MIEIGKCYLFHTHLGIWLGRVNFVQGQEIMLDQCSWIAEQGRMGLSVREGKYDRCEFVGDGVIVPSNCVKVPWLHALPKQDL